MNINDTRNNHFREDDEKPIHIRELWHRFLRRQKLFLYIAIPAFIIISFIHITKPYSPIYRASFDLGISEERSFEGFSSSFRETPAGSQIGSVTKRLISNLLSVNLAEKVIDTLSFYAYLKGRNSDIRIEVQAKEEFDRVVGPLRLEIVDGRFKIFNNGDRIKEGRLNETVDFESFELNIIPEIGNVNRETYELSIYPKNRMALALRNSLSIKILDADKIVQGSGSSGIPFSGEGASDRFLTGIASDLGMLKISVYWGNPEDALRIAQILSVLIMMENVEEKSLKFIQSKKFLESQLVLYQEKLNEHAEKIREFKRKENIADLDASTQVIVSQISQIELRKSQLEIEQKILKDLNKYILGTNTGSLDTTLHTAVTLLSDLVLQNFYLQFLQVEAELKAKLKEYSSGHPKVVQIQAKLDGLKEQMKEEITKKMPTIKAEIRNVENQIKNLLTKLGNLSEEEIGLATLERDRETAEKLYAFFVEKLEETRVEEAGVTSDLRIINPPILFSSDPVNSRGTFRSLILALILSILAGGFGVFIAEYFDNTAKNPNQVAEKIGLPIFASIPIIDGTKREVKKLQFFEALIKIGSSHRHRRKKPSRGSYIINSRSYSAEFEAFRKLSINLEFAHPEEKYKAIYITSTGPDEGKTFISANLGLSLASTNKRVIAIDTDFRKRRGRLTDLVNAKQKKGLFEVLKGESTPKEAITTFTPLQSPQRPNSSAQEKHRNTDTPELRNFLEILPIGKKPPNPFVFLQSENMHELIAKLKESYDYVIIDGVPLLLFADAVYLANFVDGVLLATKYGKTGFKELEYSRDMLLSTKANIIGIVMNCVPKTREGYYYYYHYYYHKYYPKYCDKNKQ